MSSVSKRTTRNQFIQNYSTQFRYDSLILIRSKMPNSATKRRYNSKFAPIAFAMIAIATHSTALANSLELTGIQTKLESPTTQHNARQQHPIDAPKFYHLNELLYKSTSAGDSPQAAALPGTFGADGTDNDLGPPGSMAASPMQAPIKPRGMKLDVDDDGNDSSIESLLRAMRRRNSMSSSNEMSAFDSAGRKRTSDDRASMRADDESTDRKSVV